MALSWLTTDYMRAAMQQPGLAKRLRGLATDNATFWMGLFRHGDLEHSPDPPALGRLSQIRARTLLLVGDRDNLVIRSIVDTLAARIPGARLLTIHGAGHMVNMERPLEFNRAVLSFLR
jgi:pimeloyl-ACP methyl ester carboxylesterase